jgi:methylglutaconyl-CoA hydratase
MFCAGADLKERKTMNEEEVKTFVRKLRSTFSMFEQMECPTISVVDGPALGGGCELALCSDMRIATKEAIFGLPETGLAIIPGAGGTQRLSRLIGVSRAKELIFTGDRLTADQALGIGLVNHVSADFDSAIAKAKDIAAKIGEKGPIAIRAAKKAVHFGIDLDLEKGLALEDECYKMVINTEDRLEGLKAFAEKRKPVYKGK